MLTKLSLNLSKKLWINPFKFSTSKYFEENQIKNFIITTHDSKGLLQKVSQILNSHNFDLTFIESQLSHIHRNNKQDVDFKVSIKNMSDESLHKVENQLAKIGATLKRGPVDQVDWFPRNSRELDLIGTVLLKVKDTQGNDSLQFKDEDYRKRRDYIAQVSKNHKMNSSISRIKYLQSQNKTWQYCYEKLRRLHKIAMCSRFQKNMQKLQKEIPMNKQIPQLEDIDKFLRSESNFRIKPTHGILSARQFFNSLGHRAFCCTQYIRHPSVPQYTPQPDIIHQVLGHVPLFADKQVADFSHQIGLLSLGATDQQISQLGSLYWFTIQFGVCRENGKILGYGAGVGSSFGQIQHFLQGKAKFEDFNPIKNAKQSYPIQTVQPIYKVANSFEESLNQLREYSKTVVKKMNTYYDFNRDQVKYDRQIRGVYKE